MQPNLPSDYDLVDSVIEKFDVQSTYAEKETHSIGASCAGPIF